MYINFNLYLIYNRIKKIKQLEITINIKKLYILNKIIINRQGLINFWKR